MVRHLLSVLAAISTIALPTATLAQCVNPITPSCSVYDTCFSKLCSCDGSPYEYFKSYGKKYCTVFLDLPGLSTKGKTWRDSTLRCLQEELVPKLPPDGKANSCDCKAVQTIAFDTHVACYTKPTDSICNLPASDWLIILKSVDPIKSLTDQKSRKQMLEVAKICLPIAAKDAQSAIRQTIETLKP
jgi:hypothetical protein